MKPRFIPIILLLFVVFLYPFTSHGQEGTYNTVSRLAYCENYSVCLHEIAHALDQRAGWVSQSPKFYKALQIYLYVEMRKPELSAMPADILELTYRGGDDMRSIKMEIYAYLFQWSQGDPNRMSDAFRDFYDWETARRLILMLDPSYKLYWLN